MFFIEGNTAIDLKDRKIALFKACLHSLPVTPLQALATFNFLLRRTDAKQHLLTFVEQLFKNHPASSVLLTVLEKIVTNYLQSVVEKREFSLKSKLLFQTSNLKNGEQFLDELEIVEVFCNRFGKYASESAIEVKNSYLHILTALFLELMAAESQIDALTNVLVKWMLRMNQSNLLRQFYLSGFLKESVLLAIVFCESGSNKRIHHTLGIAELEKDEALLNEVTNEGRRESLQIGIEFLRRVKHLFAKKDYQKVLSVYLIENHRICEAVALVQSGELEIASVDIKKLLTNSKSKNSNYHFNNCMAFVNLATGFKLHNYITNAELEKIIKM